MRLPQISYLRILEGKDLSLLDRACMDWGFFELVDTPILPEIREEMLDAMEHFFSLSTEDKRRVERTEENHWGFYDRELTKNVKDWKEIFDVGPESGSCIPQFPEGETAFRNVTNTYYQQCESVALNLVSALARALGSEPDSLRRGFDNHTSYLRMNYYPLCPNPAPSGTPADARDAGHLGISHHSDAGAVTVLLMDGVDGLQVDKAGEWVPVSCTRGSLIINIGDVVQVWSNDRYKAPLHRVLANHQHTRYSAPFFLNPSFDATYAPLSSITGNTGPLYRPISWREFREGRAAGDYADVGTEVQISDYRVAASS